MRKAHIISIGNELLIGDTVNTNASWLGGILTESGFYVERVFTLPDDYTAIQNQVDHSFQTADVTIVTGGLGPTHDDITKKAVAELLDCKLIQDERVHHHVKKIFETRQYVFTRANADQALVPDRCEVLFNKQGTAPGMWFQKEGRYLAVLPGVPYEMKYLMKEEVKPRLVKCFPGGEIMVTEYFKTAGIPESTLSDQIGSLVEFENNGVAVAYLPGTAGVTVRISASGRDGDEAARKLEKLKQVISKRAGDSLYGHGKDFRLAEMVGNILAEKKLTLATAESCTGGLLANSITDIPGSSAYMLGGMITYSNEMKIRHLNVPEEDIKYQGAVSKIVALRMARGVAEKCGADIGVSATGIAGPGGGTKQKPVGTVWMGFWIEGKHFALKTVFTNDRLLNKERTVMVILDTLRRQLLGLESFPYHLKPQFA
ncbi:MAG: competence/damage-inducible protein A [Balneolaceae bacterium]